MSKRPKTARDIMLDPHGIYGARTASRVALARRRRNLQGFGILITLGVAGAILLARNIWPRARNVAPFSQIALPDAPAVPPVLVETGEAATLIVPLQSGSVQRVALKPPQSVQRLYTTGFPAAAAPLVVGETLYLNCEDGFLRALDLKTGKARWGTRLPGTPVARPVVVRVENGGARTLVVAGDDSGFVVACESRGGKIAWRTQLGAPIGAELRAISVNGRACVLAPLLGSPARGGGLACLDALSGAEVWNFGAKQARASQLHAPEALEFGGGTRLLCADAAGALFALSARDGKLLWFKDATVGRASDTNKSSGDVAWRGGMRAWMGGDGRARVAGGGNDGEVRCLDAQNGRLLWRFSAEVPLLAPPTPMLLPARGGIPAREWLLIAPQEAKLWALDAGSGMPLREFALDAPAVGSPFALGGRIVVVTQRGSILFFDALAEREE